MSQVTETKNGSPNSTSPKQVVRVRPAIDLIEQDQGFLMLVEMPGVDADHVEVAVEQNVLSIKGTADLGNMEGYSPVAGEFRTRVFERAFQISNEIDRDGIDAEMKNGVLRLQLPKSQRAKRTFVTVKSV